MVLQQIWKKLYKNIPECVHVLMLFFNEHHGFNGHLMVVLEVRYPVLASGGLFGMPSDVLNNEPREKP